MKRVIRWVPAHWLCCLPECSPSPHCVKEYIFNYREEGQGGIIRLLTLRAAVHGKHKVSTYCGPESVLGMCL